MEVSKRKAYSRLERGPASTSQIIAWQEQHDGMTKVLTDPQKRERMDWREKGPRSSKTQLRKDVRHEE